MDLYKSGGPFVPEKEVSQATGKTVKMEKKPDYFGKAKLPQKTQKAPDRTGLKKIIISDIRASDKRLYDAGVGKKPSLVQQRKFAKEKIKAIKSSDYIERSGFMVQLVQLRVWEERVVVQKVQHLLQLNQKIK